MDYSKIGCYNRHGGAYDRGAADKYYGRKFEPHYRIFDNGRLIKTASISVMTDDDIAAYTQGYNDEEKGKDYGVDDLRRSNDAFEASLKESMQATNEWLQRNGFEPAKVIL